MCWDNAAAESFFAALKNEMYYRQSFPGRARARFAAAGYIEVFYNRQRRHKTLGQLSPADFENSTLITRGTGLAAARLASPDKIKFTTLTASALA